MIHTNKKNNVNGLKSPSKVSLVRSKSTDHLISTHKSISRKNLIDKGQRNDLSTTKISHLVKSKSVKTLKTKAKSAQKIGQNKSTKKIKTKVKKNQQSDCKTVKKQNKKILRANLSEQSFSSLQSAKHQALQYFLYQNTYIPIENSAQRRLIFRIKEIDKRNQQTADTFFKKTYPQNQSRVQKVEKQQIKCVSKIDSSIQTEKILIVQFGTNTTPRFQNQLSIQTEIVKFQQDIEKCFSHTLNDLQFLFLPDQTNFQGFSKPERLHYRDLFESIAKKIWANGQNLQQLTDEQIQILLYQRQCIQMGMIEFYPQEGFPTHIYAIMSYLTNLFAFAQMTEKQEALQKIHNIYGFSYQERFSRLLRHLPTKKRSPSILSEQLFLQFQKQLFKDHQFKSDVVQKSVHIHNKAIFDAVNQELQKFKPFYFSKGEPFPWSINVGMTFFSIDQSSVGLLFKQIKEKILIKFGYMCGILVDYDDFKDTENKQKHPIHIKKLQQQQQKMIQDDIVEQNYSPDIQQADATLRTDISTWILAQLLQELCFDMLTLKS